MEEKVSIILPTYNAQETLIKAVQSVLNQTYKNIELIVIENGPKGKIKEYLNTCKLEKKQEIKYFYSDVANVSNARNIGIDNSTGKYLAFIDSDDCYEKDFLKKMILKIEKSNLQLVTCGYKTVYSKENKLIKDYEKIENKTDIKFYLETLKENYLFNELWSKLYLNSIIQKKKIRFNKDYELGEDFIFNLDYLENVERAGFINEPLYIYTDGKDGLKLKYRNDKFEIEYNLTQYLKKFYKKQGYSMDYIYNRFARVYYNGILNIYAKNSPLTKKEKDKQLSEFIKSDRYINDLNDIKNNVSDKKFKLAVNIFFLKGKLMVKLFVVLANLRKK